MSNDLLPGSSNHLYERQVKMIQELSGKARVNYEVPSLKVALGVIFLHKVATGKSLLKVATGGKNIFEENTDLYPYTRVTEAYQKHQLLVGGSTSSGVAVHYYRRQYDDFVDERKGVLVVRKL